MRWLSLLRRSWCLPQPASRALTTSSHASFTSLLQPLARDLALKDIPTSLRPLLFEHLEKMVTYNLEGGKLNRGLAVVSSYECLVPRHTQADLRLAMLLGWAVELLQAFFLVADDMMDASLERRGRPCWYRLPGVGTTAINDSLVLESCLYSVLRAECSHLACYQELVDTFLRVTRLTCLGQALDLSTAATYMDDRSIAAFTRERWDGIVRHKTSHYSFCLPVHLALLLAGYRMECQEHQYLFTTSEDILLSMGDFFQAQDDFLDCFGDPATTGKVGTDIQDGKCSWLMVRALEVASQQEREVLEANYGLTDPQNVEIVKQLFRDLKVDLQFRIFEAEMHRQLMAKIGKVEGLPQELFTNFLDMIYKRAN